MSLGGSTLTGPQLVRISRIAFTGLLPVVILFDIVRSFGRGYTWEANTAVERRTDFRQIRSHFGWMSPSKLAYWDFVYTSFTAFGFEERIALKTSRPARLDVS